MGTGMQWSFIDLAFHGRSLVKVVLPGACEMLAFTVSGPRHRVDPEEADYLRRARFREVAPDLFVRMGCVVAEAGLLTVYRRARTVDFDPARHVTDVLPGDGGDMRALTFSVAADLMVEEFQGTMAGLRPHPGETAAPDTLERLRDETVAMSARTAALLALREAMLPEADAQGSAPSP